MSRIKTHVKKGDQVTVIAGAHKGAEGAVLKVDTEKGRVFVEGVSKIKRTVKGTQEKPEGGYKDLDRPIAISNVKLSSERPTKASAKNAAVKNAAKKVAKKSVD